METDGLVIVGKKDTYQGSDNSVILLNRETSLCAFLSLSLGICLWVLDIICTEMNSESITFGNVLD